KWAEVDTSEQFLGTYAMDPSVPPFKFIVANKADREANEIVDIVGKSCGGEMLLLDSRVPLLEAGDLIALLDTGAYIESLSCNFNAMPRPGTLLISDDQAEWIREPESIEQVFSRDRVPVWTRNNR
ncbi:MAG: diaminopimelate decarboxylase, partial [Gammaproteobacteria bacterium]|nr:diaminopimelate decarboxylase [Gammaproteobacteria bacterium]